MKNVSFLLQKKRNRLFGQPGTSQRFKNFKKKIWSEQFLYPKEKFYSEEKDKQIYLAIFSPGSSPSKMGYLDNCQTLPCKRRP